MQSALLLLLQIARVNNETLNFFGVYYVKQLTLYVVNQIYVGFTVSVYFKALHDIRVNRLFKLECDWLY